MPSLWGHIFLTFICLVWVYFTIAFGFLKNAKYISTIKINSQIAGIVGNMKKLFVIVVVSSSSSFGSIQEEDVSKLKYGL
jgi:cellulose synthase/poly-beta-1,6-N-acetylglucosamine synthase-like glycosyltransferase